MLSGLGCDITVVPATTTAEEALRLDPDGVFLSNGPGDPEPCVYAIQAARALMLARPTFGICLGHQIMGLACGGRTFKLKFGHRGANHPVRNFATGTCPPSRFSITRKRVRGLTIATISSTSS